MVEDKEYNPNSFHAVISRINTRLEQEKQQLLQEVLRTDGEVRILEKLSEGEE